MTEVPVKMSVIIIFLSQIQFQIQSNSQFLLLFLSEKLVKQIKTQPWPSKITDTNTRREHILLQIQNDLDYWQMFFLFQLCPSKVRILWNLKKSKTKKFLRNPSLKFLLQIWSFVGRNYFKTRGQYYQNYLHNLLKF